MKSLKTSAFLVLGCRRKSSKYKRIDQFAGDYSRLRCYLLFCQISKIFYYRLHIISECAVSKANMFTLQEVCIIFLMVSTLFAGLLLAVVMILAIIISFEGNYLNKFEKRQNRKIMLLMIKFYSSDICSWKNLKTID